MIKGPGPAPPPPPPPANPPQYASAMTAKPSTTTPFGALGNSLMTGPLGAPDLGLAQRKSLFGQ